MVGWFSGEIVSLYGLVLVERVVTLYRLDRVSQETIRLYTCILFDSCLFNKSHSRVVKRGNGG